MAEPLKVILIGGTSHVGKSTLARDLAARLGWEVISTDSLARHPGRPWGGLEARPHVAEHYRTHDVEQLIGSVLGHYRRLWPMVRDLIETRLNDPSASPLVLEGSALWPEQVADLGFDGVAAIWLTGSDALFEARIKAESRHHAAAPEQREMIDKFIGRTKRYNDEMMRHVQRLKLRSLDVEREPDVVSACARELAIAG